MARITLLFDRQDHKPMTPNQMHYIALIEHRLNTEFKGTSYQEAADFIDKAVQANPHQFYTTDNRTIDVKRKLLSLLDDFDEATTELERRNISYSALQPLQQLLNHDVRIEHVPTLLKGMVDARHEEIEHVGFGAHDPTISESRPNKHVGFGSYDETLDY